MTQILPVDGLASVDVRSVAIDKSGNKWFGHGDPDLGVSMLRADGTWSQVGSFEGLQLDPGKKVNTLFALGDSVWIGTESGATLFIGGEREIIVSQEKEGIVSDQINAVLAHGSDVWFGTAQGLSRFSSGTVRNYTIAGDSLPASEVTCLAVDDEGTIWGGSSRGYFLVVNGEVEVPEFSELSALRIRSIAFEDDAGGQVPWFATDDGPYRETERKANKESGVPIGNPEQSMAVVVDDEGDIWLANGNRWVFRWIENADGWEDFTQSGNVQSNFISDIAVDWGGLVWCPLVGNLEGDQASPGRRMMIWDKALGVWNAIGSAVLADTFALVSQVAIDSVGNRWFGVRRGGNTGRGSLLKIDRNVGSTVGADDIQYFQVNAPGFTPNQRAIYGLSIGPDNTKWLAITSEGVAALDPEENRDAWGGYSDETATCIPSENPSAIDVTVAPNGVVWIALERSSAASIDYNGTLTDPTDDICTHYSSSDTPLPSNALFAVRADHLGRIWFGTQGGLAMLIPASDTWKVFTEQNTGGGLRDSRCRAIDFDDAGNIWVGTFGGGLSVLKPDLENWYEPWTIQDNLRRESGMTSNSIMALDIVRNESNEEEVWIATWGGGAIRFVPDLSDPDTPIEPGPDESPPISVYPNPYRAGEESADFVSFANVPIGGSIEIFTLTGERIRSLEGPTGAEEDDPVWDLRNEESVIVASGIYLYLVKKNGEVYHRGKVAYVR